MSDLRARVAAARAQTPVGRPPLERALGGSTEHQRALLEARLRKDLALARRHERAEQLAARTLVRVDEVLDALRVAARELRRGFEALREHATLTGEQAAEIALAALDDAERALRPLEADA